MPPSQRPANCAVMACRAGVRSNGERTIMTKGIGRTLALVGAISLAATVGHAAEEIKGGAGAAMAPAAPKMTTITQDLLDRAAGDRSNFLHTNGNYWQSRFHTANQITTGNDKGLHQLWNFQIAVLDTLETTL